jgi:hypothetical protein
VKLTLLSRQRRAKGGLAAEVRDLLKEVLADVEIVEDVGFKRRADRALAEYDGVVEPGQDIVYEYRDREARIVLSHMAEVWLRLAERNVPEQTQPAFQQQQQIQPKDDDKK